MRFISSLFASKLLLRLTCSLVLLAIVDPNRLPARESALPAVPANWQQLVQADPQQLQLSFTEVLNSQWNSVEISTTDNANALLSKADQVFAINAMTRQRIADLWKLRTEIQPSASGPKARVAAAAFLKTISAWVEFSGRLRYATREHVQQTVRRLPRHDVSRLIALAQRHQVGIVAPAIAFVLVQPPAGSKATAFDDATRMQLLQLIKTTHEIDATPALYELLQWPHTPDVLRLHLLDSLRSIGISQASLQDNHRATPAELMTRLEAIEPASLSIDDRQLRVDLLGWLGNLSQHGVSGETFRWGPVEIRSGDWILQRNPSPYNRFTDLSPGLFTHVGIAASITDESGIRRIVIVDLPETGTQIQSDTADEFVSSSLHWLVLRHRDDKSAAAMGRIAADLIGREAEFDLTFNTSLVQQQRGIVDNEQPVRTYCAGFLALCGQEAGLQRSDLFPFIEHPINDRCAKNLKNLGLTMTEFVSPSGPLFASEMRVVGSRPPMYSPDNEIREAVYDRFARKISESEFQMHETSAQKLRQQLAEMSSDYAWVRAALAQVNDVSPSMDLVVAGRVATIVENLDAIADTQAQGFSDALTLVQTGKIPAKASASQTARMAATLKVLQAEQSTWFSDWKANKLTQRQLRQILVQHYAGLGQTAVDRMFFPESE